MGYFPHRENRKQISWVQRWNNTPLLWRIFKTRRAAVPGRSNVNERERSTNIRSG